jgi:hypothetical protein
MSQRKERIDLFQSIPHETRFPRTREHFEKVSEPGVRLHAPISLLAHLETEMSWQPGRVDRPRGLILMGNLHLPELRAEITFGRHNGHANGNGHSEKHRTSAAIIRHRFSMAIQLQHLAQPAQEEKDVWSSAPGPDHDLPWVERYAGRLGDEPLTIDRYVPVDMSLDVMFGREECKTGRTTNVHVTGELRFDRSVCMRLRFSDPKHSMASPRASGRDGVELIVGGTRVSIPSQTVSGLADRSASMSVRVIETGGRLVCGEHPLREFAPV